MKYKVYGTVEVTVTLEVEANDVNEAFEIAEAQRDSLSAYVGNGGMDKLVGVSSPNESIEAVNTINYFKASEIR